MMALKSGTVLGFPAPFSYCAWQKADHQIASRVDSQPAISRKASRSAARLGKGRILPNQPRRWHCTARAHGYQRHPSPAPVLQRRGWREPEQATGSSASLSGDCPGPSSQQGRHFSRRQAHIRWITAYRNPSFPKCCQRLWESPPSSPPAD